MSRPEDFSGIVTLLKTTNMWNDERDDTQLAFSSGSRLVAALGKTIIGHVYPGDRDGIPVAEAVVVDPAYRNQGIGSLLLRYFELVSDLGGRTRVEVQIDDDRPDLFNWYKRRGYEPAYRCIGMVKKPTDTPMTISTSDAIIAVAQEAKVGTSVYTPETIVELQESLTQARPTYINRIGIRTEGDSSGIGINLTPWCLSVSNDQELVRWGTVPIKGNNLGHLLLREFRAPIQDSPDLRGKTIDAFGRYIVSHFGEYPKTGVFEVSERRQSAFSAAKEISAQTIADLKHVGNRSRNHH
jgi:hypothetical protein